MHAASSIALQLHRQISSTWHLIHHTIPCWSYIYTSITHLPRKPPSTKPIAITTIARNHLLKPYHPAISKPAFSYHSFNENQDHLLDNNQCIQEHTALDCQTASRLRYTSFNEFIMKHRVQLSPQNVHLSQYLHLLSRNIESDVHHQSTWLKHEHAFIFYEFCSTANFTTRPSLVCNKTKTNYLDSTAAISIMQHRVEHVSRTYMYHPVNLTTHYTSKHSHPMNLALKRTLLLDYP